MGQEGLSASHIKPRAEPQERIWMYQDRSQAAESKQEIHSIQTYTHEDRKRAKRK